MTPSGLINDSYLIRSHTCLYIYVNSEWWTFVFIIHNWTTLMYIHNKYCVLCTTLLILFYILFWPVFNGATIKKRPLFKFKIWIKFVAFGEYWILNKYNNYYVFQWTEMIKLRVCVVDYWVQNISLIYNLHIHSKNILFKEIN